MNTKKTDERYKELLQIAQDDSLDADQIIELKSLLDLVTPKTPPPPIRGWVNLYEFGETFSKTTIYPSLEQAQKAAVRSGLIRIAEVREVDTEN